tara:strand:- start:7297 stop:7593 length:297 start_codon:yes stop_codon:yes gene_type:complete
MLPYYKDALPCDWCGSHTHGRIHEKDIICGSCKKVIINDWEKNFDEREPERYYEWILWKTKKEDYRDAMTEKGTESEARTNNSWTSRNRKDDDSSEHS